MVNANPQRRCLKVLNAADVFVVWPPVYPCRIEKLQGSGPDWAFFGTS